MSAMLRRSRQHPSSVERRHRAEEARRRSITMTLNRLGVRYCSCSCGRYCDDLFIAPDGTAVPMAFRCAEIARANTEAMPA